MLYDIIIDNAREGTPRCQSKDDKLKLRDDLTPAEREKAERIVRIEFKSAAATRKTLKERP